MPALSLQPIEIVRNFSGLLATIEEAANSSVQANETVTETLQQVLYINITCYIHSNFMSSWLLFALGEFIDV